MAIYVLAFVPLYQVLGSAADVLVTLPVAVVGLFYGLRGGLVAGLLTLPLNLLLLSSIEHKNWGGDIRQVIELGCIYQILVGATIGWLAKVNKRSMRVLPHRVQAETASRLSDGRCAALLDNSLTAVVLLNADGTLLYESPSVCRILGYETAGLGRRNWFELLHPDDVQSATNLFTQLVQQREPAGVTQAQHRFRHKDGSWRWIESSSTNRLTEPDVQAVVTHFWDITERIQREHALLESEEKFHLISDQPIMGISIIQDNQIRYGNQALANINGYSLTEMMGWSTVEYSKLIHPDDLAFAVEQVRKKQRGDPDAVTHYSYRLITKNQEIKWVDQYSKTISYQNRSADLIAMIDISERVKAEQALRESEERYRVILEATVDALVLHEDGVVIQANRSSKAVLGYEPTELVGRNVMDVLGVPGSAEKMRHNIQTHFEGTYETPLKRKDGTTFTAEIQARNVIYQGRQVRVASVHNITERKQAETSLRENAERLRVALSSINIAVFNQDSDLRYTWMYQPQMGYTTQEVLGHTDFELLPADAAEKTSKIKRQVIESAAGVRDEICVKTGARVHIYDLMVEPLHDTAGNVIGITGATLDITERKQAEDALRQSEERFRLLVENSPTGIYMSADSPNVSYANQRLADTLGYTPTEIMESPFTRFIAEEDVALLVDYYERRRRGEKVPNHYEFNAVRKDGQRRRFDLYISTSTSPDEKIHTWGQILDITERKQAEEDLRASEARYRTLFEYAPDGIFLTDSKGVLIDANARGLQMLGYTKDEFFGMTIYHVVLETEISRASAEFAEIMEGRPYQREWHFKRKDGSTFPSEVIATLMPDGNAMGIIRDITERKQAEEDLRKAHEELELRVQERTAALTEANEKLQAAKERVEAILNNSADGILLAQSDFVIQQTNAAFNRLFDCEANAYLNAPLMVLFDAENTDTLTHTLQTGIGEGYGVNIEARAHRHSGTEFDAECSISYLNNGGFVCTIRDVTKRKKAEAALQQALEKEKELGELKSRFVSMASHEFRNPLATILALTETLRVYRQRMADGEIQEQVGKIQEQVEHLKDIMEDVLLLARLQARRANFNPVMVNPDTLCRSILNEFQSRPDITHQLLYTCDDPVPMLKLDKKVMRQIVSNLVSNAIKYSPKDKLVMVTLEYGDETLVLKVRDSGIGIPEADLKHLFEPFHRATNVGVISGTGLGLVITKESVELHGGTITVETQVGVGTMFIVTIPITASGR